jgi:hypothetical protein
MFRRTGAWLLIPLAMLISTGGSVVSASDVHVTCANTTEDAAALNAAIRSSQTGDAIRIHGTCLLTETVILRSNRSYLGDSRTGTMLRQADGANLAALVASDTWQSNATYTGSPVRIAHMTLDGNKASNQGTSNLVIRSWLTVIEDLQVRNAPADGIQLTSLGIDGQTRLTNTQVNGRISNCFVTGSGAKGIHVVDPGNSVTDWDLLDCWIASSGQSGIYLENAAGWKVKGNHVYGVPQHAIYAHRCWGTTIADNYIEGFGEAGGKDDTWYGIACTVQGGAASVISGNKVFRLQEKAKEGIFVYLAVPQVNYGTGMISVVGNAIRGRGGEREIGLWYAAGRGAGLSVLSGNNHVQFVGMPRLVGEKATLAEPY